YAGESETCPFAEELASRNSYNIQYDWVEVSEDIKGLGETSSNISEKIKVAFFYRPAQHDDPKIDQTPILFLNGGPGMDSHHMMMEMVKRDELKNIPLVFMDQRGTGCSSSYPRLNSETIQRSLNWGSRAIVEDAEAIRYKLFKDRKWKLFGHSYGGLVAFRYIANHGDSLVNATVYGYSLTKDPIDWLYNQTLFIEDQSLAYLEEYPGDRELIKSVRELIHSDTCLSVKDYQICGDAIIDSLGEYLAFQDYWVQIHTTLENLKKFWGTRFEEQQMASLARLIFGQLAASDGNIVQNAISNFEIVPGYTPHQAYAEVEKRMIKNNVSVENWLFNPVYYMKHLKLGSRSSLFKNLPNDELSIDEVYRGLRNHPEIMVNLFSGSRDGIMPPTNYLEFVHKIDAYTKYEEIPYVSHNDYLQERIIEELAKSTQFDFEKCISLNNIKAISLIKGEFLPWIGENTEYDVDKLGEQLPKVCTLSQKEINYAATGVYNPSGPSINAFYLLNSHESNGIILLNKNIDWDSLRAIDQLIHEVIHFVQYKNGMFPKYSCQNESEKEAYLLGGTYMRSIGVDAFSDPFPNRSYWANIYSRCEFEGFMD
ncbi:MAG: alpha/beta hydrolase, partial [Bdellovibrionales bacterium]|nr:alpha/beta hydrolase [Bdellovibrionales bacterium]